ncbi:MAG: hypothetical protein DRJ42_30935 [Deltaproteobacteria bacterium]|nr:MAG: hypothetical protein DRJ42_30935 [Deltaproteobacteria bacterium]
MKLIQDSREFIELLNSESVPFLVIGGWAFNRYAEPRFTGDIDFFLRPDADTERRLRRVLEAFGFGPALPPPERSLFTKPVIMLGRPPHRIDLITAIDGVTFDEAWEDRESSELDGIPVHFISRQHLLTNKRAAGRDKDLADVRVLEKLSSD